MPILEGHPNLSDPIHPFLPTLIPRKDWNRCKYILATNRFLFAMENRAQQQARAQSNSYIPKWEYLPNWDCVIQTHPLQSIQPHPPWGADKGPICVIKYPEPKYIFFPPENACQRAQKRKTVSGHLGNAVSHVVDTCLQQPSIPPNSAAPGYLPALTSGTLGRWSTLPAHVKYPISNPNHFWHPGRIGPTIGFWA